MRITSHWSKYNTMAWHLTLCKSATCFDLGGKVYILYMLLFQLPVQNVPMSKRPNVITSHSQNVPKSKRPKSKRPTVITSQVKTSHSQNVPSQNVPQTKRPKSKRPKSKRPKFMTNLIHVVCKLMEAYMIGWLVCVCLMTQ